MKNHRIKDLLAGALIASLLFTLASPTFAALTGKTIEAFTGIKVYVNDHIVDPKDANGNPVDILVYNGTTYLPIRAIGNALGLPVQYDGATQTAYIGTHCSETPAVYLADLDYFSGTSDVLFETATSENDNLGQGHSHCITYPFSRTYKLNGQYTGLTGTLYQSYKDRSETISTKEDYISGLWIYGDGQLLYVKEYAKPTTGIEPEEIDIDLTGILELKVVFRCYQTFWNDDTLSLGEMALYT